jgi:hypothetical protein
MDGGGLAGHDGLGRALEEVGGRQLHALFLLDGIDLPTLLIGEVSGGDAPALVRVAELAHHKGTRDGIHLDHPLPHVAPFH